MDATPSSGSGEAPTPPRAPDRIIICGLGDVGRQCAELLKEFGACVVGVDVAPPKSMEDAPFDKIVTGDCTKSEILKRAGAETCRAILLVTTDERSNIAAAFAARSLNPRVRLVIRSAQEQLNRLLAGQLGNLVAFEPHEFSALAFAVATLDDETKARFDLNGSTVRVIAHIVKTGDWRHGLRPSELNTLHRRVIGHVSEGKAVGDLLSLRSADCEIRPGDEVTYVECGELLRDARGPRTPEAKSRRVRWTALAEQARGWLRAAPKPIIVSFAVVFSMFALCIVLYRRENPEISWFDAINVSTVLAVGGFDNVFGALKAPFPISSGLYLYSLLMKIGSAIFLGVIIATMTERVLGARFQIAARRPPPPVEGHTIVVGLAPIGQNIAALLQRWGRPTVGVSAEPVAEDVLRGLPVKTGPIPDALARANIAAARSVVVVGDDQVGNLETALLAHSLNPRCALVFRVADPDLARNVAALIPESTGISESEIAAQAIAGAAFDENILTAFQLLGRPVLVTEYAVAHNRPLLDLQLAQLAYGFGAIPIFHERGGAGQLNPSDDIRLERDDKVVVLATVAALRRIERNELEPPDCRLLIDSSLSADAAFEAGNVIARIAGCDLAIARQALAHLPSELGAKIYRQQGVRLVRELRKIKVDARLIDG
ncbi:NAD-binding protein [Rhodoblastus acidophilus]|uniref:NAD-binding protein n=1 Tax=Candidatus Rhodoblastus alkanivorans TaxID=2954117 RepID=A0ABS9ZB76_9HYPH|nr:NAD-binding protein [Candidatus Rhodoblastus alkanivorans]MCI4677233.1 NAD-binding protein [Candidatus Rhodoblastus alkanivorans]MCI4684585.1 NAD-binding protein [Candidatus Rhodoblastus alkanivorans]MDI4641907.1 NAD-binding protein [Rhodoblastus acidophilus]